MNYYNEFDPGAAQWLRNLIQAGKLPTGDVDERDIRLVQPAELEKYTQCHFFAGIGGWALALALAGWDESRQVWTGSCPCQPFSVCGSRKGTSDERHLWPEFKRLISKRRPPVVFGEQVASKDGVEWLSGVRLDLEACGYAVGGADLPAASVQAPHIRQRLWFVADSKGERLYGIKDTSRTPRRNSLKDGGPARYWGAFDIVKCTDGKTRRIEPGTFPLAYGVPGRVVKLRAYGNAIVPQVAAEFIKAYLRTCA